MAMSAVSEREISRIQDEDVLKKMWQDTEDFGKKKEIRAHMYKLREERLKDLYCNSDIKDVHLITNKKQPFNQSMHADALADHSFASLKRKEIRDSESPTKEVSYRIRGPSSNEGWNISKIEEHSQDGKNHRYQQSAHTSGTEFIPKGKLDFEAKNSQEQTSYHDGDNNNFVKSQGTSSNSFIRQEAVGGDENSSFKKSSTKSSTSSRTVTEMKSSNGDAVNYVRQPVDNVDHNNFKTSSTINNSSSKTFTDQRSSDDTVDYPRKQLILESTGRNDNNKFSTSSNMSTSSKTVTEQKSYGDSVNYTNKPLQISEDSVVDKTTKVYTTDAPRELKSHPGYVEGRTKVTRETKTLADGTVVTTTKYETSGANEAKSTSSNHYTSSSSTFQDSKSNVINSKSNDDKFSTHRVITGRDYEPSGKKQPKSRYYVEKTHTIPDNTETVYHNVNTRRESNVSEKKSETSKNYQSSVDQIYETRNTNESIQNRGETRNTENVRKQTVQHIEIDDGRRDNIDIQRKENVRKEVVDQNRVQQRTVATHDVNSVPLGTPIEIEINLTRINENQERNFKPQNINVSYEPQTDRNGPKSTPNIYDTPQRREPVKHETELKTKTKATEGQYNTTYKTDYTNKKISVELSPTHDAFARSLRAVSPDRLNSRTSSRNLKNSNSSLRSSSSPEKSYLDRRHPQRSSPERHTNGRCYSPTKKTPEKFSSTETITYRTSSKPVSQRNSQDKTQKSRHTTELKLTTNHSTNTLTKKPNKPDDKTYKTPQSTPKNVPRSSIPNGRDETNICEITTDLDDNVSTFSHTTVTKTTTDRVHSDIDIKNIKEISIEDQKKTIQEDTSTKVPLKKDVPIDRPLKRTDTYEERCRQILGITSDTTERRRSSLEKLRKRGSNVSSLTESFPKTEKPDETPSKKSPETVRPKSPTKQGTPIREYPSQVRKSPEQYTPEKKVTRELSLTKERKPSVERKPIQEFPSQIRKSPTKETSPKQDSPTRSYPRGSIDTRPERKPSTDRNQIQEFPSQIRKSPTKEGSPTKCSPNEKTCRRNERKPSTENHEIQEFPSQFRKSPEKQVSPTRSSPKGTTDIRQDRKPSVDGRPTQEYPSNRGKSPEKQLSPTRKSSKGTIDTKQERKPSTERKPIQEFPSQIRHTPDAKERRPSVQNKTIEEYTSQSPQSPEKRDRNSPEKIFSRKITERRDDEESIDEVTRDEVVTKRYTTTSTLDEEERRTSTGHEVKNQVQFTDYRVRDNIHKEISTFEDDTRRTDQTVDFNSSKPWKNNPNKEKSPEKNIPDNQKSPKSPGKTQKISEIEDFKQETTFYRKPSSDNIPKKQPTTDCRTTKEPLQKPINKKPTPSSNFPKEDTSSEEDNTEITEVQITEEVIYDIPRNLNSNKPDTTKVTSTTTKISNVDEKNLKNTVTVRSTISDYVSEDEQITEDYLTKTDSDIETYERESSKRIISTDKYPEYPKSTSLPTNKPSHKDNTPQRGPISRKSPDKKIVPDATEDVISKYPDQAQPKNKGQPQTKPIDSYEIDTVERIEIVEDTTEQQTTKDENTTRTKTVDELVKSFTSKDSKRPAESVTNKPTGKPTERKPNTSSTYRKDTENRRCYEEVDTEDSTVITDEITFTSGRNKTTPTDEKPHKPSVQDTQKVPTNISPSRKSNTPQIPDECVNTYNLDIEVTRKDSTKDIESSSVPFKRIPTDKDLRKPVQPSQQIPSSTSSPQKFVPQKRSPDEEQSVTYKQDEQTVTNVISSIETDDRKTSTQKTQKGSKVTSPSKKPVEKTDTIIRIVKDIDEENYNTVKSVKNVNEDRNSQTESVTINRITNDSFVSKTSPTSTIQKKLSPQDNKTKKIDKIHIDDEEIVEIESDEDIEEINQTILSKKITQDVQRQDKNITEIRNTKYTSPDKDSRRPTNEPIEKLPTKGHPQKSSIPQKPIDREIQKPSQRSPSSSSLPKRPTTSQRIDKNDYSNVKVRNEASTIRKSNDQKRTETDFVKTKNVPSGRPNKEPTKSYPSEKPISRKPVENVERNRKPTYEQPHSDYSSEAEEEIHTKKHIMESYEGRTPVEEPIVMKKTMSLLYSDDEDDKKTTQLLIESEITERQPITDQKKQKPVKSPKTTTTKLLNNEKQEVLSQNSKSTLRTTINKTPSKPIIDRKPVKKETHINENKYNRREVTTNVNKQNTLNEIENFDDVKTNKTIHLRTNRVDETVNKKKTSILKTNDNKPVAKTPKVNSISTKPNDLGPKRPSSRNIVEKTIPKTNTKTREPTKASPKTTQPSLQPKNAISSTVSSKTKIESKTSRITSVKSKAETIKSKPVPKRITEPEDSDEESIPDSLNGSVYSSLDDVRSSIQETEVNISTSENIEDFPTVHRPSSYKPQPESRTKPELFNNEPREPSKPSAGKLKKSILINTHDRGTVDLQRSISSREATPDRMCPLPVTSDDDGYAPRYPDKVVEPDEGSTRRRHERLFETSIHEDGDYRQSRKIVEINEDVNQTVSGINRVDYDDDSLMTVDRKINKFLSTAGKLTEKSIVDISQPAPKVERPKFEVNDDLREDDCLLSVSDKVQKFITEAEHLTTHNDSHQQRKSVNIEVKSDVSNKINQFTTPQQSKPNTDSPRKSSFPRNSLPSDKDTKPDETKPRQPERQKPVSLTTLGTTKLDQDVFITTECAEIEKEEDLFRTSKVPSQPSIRPEPQPEYKSTNQFKLKTNSSDVTDKTSTQRKFSIETIEKTEDDSDDTPSKPRKNSLKEFTPKNRRPSQEEKVILSSVGRLRSNESIKKAKALFENTESITREEKRQKDILNRPSVFEGRSKTVKETNLKKNIDRNSVTPKRLVFTSEKEVEDIEQTKRRSSDQHPVEPQTKIKSNRKPSTEKDLPGYMKPLERNSKPGDQSPETEENKEILEPHQSRRKYPDLVEPSRVDKPKTNHEEVPGYMKPLEYTERNHYHVHESHTHESAELLRHDHEHKRRNVHESHDSGVPGYMKPLEYTQPNHAHVHDLQTNESDDFIGHERDHTRRNFHEGEESDVPGYMQPLEYTQPEHLHTHETQEHRNVHKDYHTEDRRTLSTESTSKHRIQNGDDTPSYMKPLDRYTKPQHPQRERSKTPESQKTSGRHPKHVGEDSLPRNTPEPLEVSEGDLPGYMKPLDRSDRTHRPLSPKKEVPADHKPREPAGTPTKFGVTLKRTDSSKGVITSVTTTWEKKHPLLTKKNVTEEEIEDVYDLEVLEELLLKFTIYELRRKIRTQIRIVKKLISENKLEITIRNLRNRSKTDQSIESTESTRNARRTTPTRKVQENRRVSQTNIAEKQEHEISEYRRESLRRESLTSSTSRTIESRRSKSPEKASPERKYPERRQSNRKTPERSSPERRSSSKPTTQRNILREETTTSYETTQKSTGKVKPEEQTTIKTTTSNVFKSSLKKTEPKSKTPTSASQPEWVTQRNLRKTGSNEVVKKSSVSSSSSTVKKQNTRSSSSKESESTDLIASSYGIGPTDENGSPLFGLRALRAQNTNGTTKVQGTVISSQYYSETGKEPVGQISFTKYSSDPRDLGSNEDLAQNGDILSVTTTQKYGYEDSPSLKQLTSTKKEICDSQSDKRRSSSKSSTITRRNSVKALTQKFVENAVEESKSERQSFYPKAGLILRSSSFKNEAAVDDDYDELLDEESRKESVSVTSSHSKIVSGGTFLRNKSKVTGVQDAISRMKTEDVVEYGDTQEDIEAKDLLNKYLGTEVILSGVEGHVSRTGTSSSRGTSLTTSNKSTSKITTVTMENGKEVTRTRIFEHPLSDDVLETVWDEKTLRYLLDQSANYEERKKLRARLRLIMAEQEACTELVKQASQDQSSQSIDETVETSREVVSEGPVTTTKVTKVTTQQHISKKPMSPFAKFRQLDKQNSLNTPPSTPRTPGGSPLFKFTDAALSQSASTIKDRLLHWCRMKTKEYENIQLDNFSSSWADGLAFCALVHHFLPDAFDYHALTPKERRHNFTLAFKVADEKADIAPLLDVDDMVETMRPDWKCVFTYVQSIYRRFKDED